MIVRIHKHGTLYLAGLNHNPDLNVIAIYFNYSGPVFTYTFLQLMRRRLYEGLFTPLETRKLIVDFLKLKGFDCENITTFTKETMFKISLICNTFGFFDIEDDLNYFDNLVKQKDTLIEKDLNKKKLKENPPTHRIRRGKVIEIPEKWRGKVTFKQTIRKRPSKDHARGKYGGKKP